MSKQQIVLGALRAQLQELQVWPPQEGTIATYGTIGTSSTEQLLHVNMANTIVLLEGALTAEKEDDRATVGKIKGHSLNLATLLLALGFGLVFALRNLLIHLFTIHFSIYPFHFDVFYIHSGI